MRKKEITDHKSADRRKRWVKQGILFGSILALAAVGIFHNLNKKEKEAVAERYVSYFSGDASKIHKSEEQKKQFIVGVSNIPSDLKPYYHDTEAGRLVAGLVYQPLIEIHSDMTMEQILAKEITFSDDGTKARITLQDAKFSDGSSLKPEDVISSYETAGAEDSIYYDQDTLLNIEGMNDYRQHKTEGIKGIKKVDDHTVEISFQQVSVRNLNALQIPILKASGEGKCALGTGSYQIDKIVYYESIQLKENKENKDSAYPYETIKIQTISYDHLEEDMKKFSLDMFFTNSEDQINMIKKQGYHNIYEVRDDNYEYLAFNLKSDAGKEKDIREAVTLGIDREQLAEQSGLLAHQSLPLGITGTDKAGKNFKTLVSQNITKAQDLWKSAGKKELTYLCTNEAYSVQFADVLKEQMKEAGIKLNVSKTDSVSYEDRLAAMEAGRGEEDLFMGSESEKMPTELAEDMIAQNEELTKNYQDLLKKNFTNDYTEVYNILEEFCIENYLIIPIANSYSYIAVSADCDDNSLIDLIS